MSVINEFQIQWCGHVGGRTLGCVCCAITEQESRESALRKEFEDRGREVARLTQERDRKVAEVQEYSERCKYFVRKSDEAEARLHEAVDALRDLATVDAVGVCNSGYSAGYVARKALAAAQPKEGS